MRIRVLSTALGCLLAACSSLPPDQLTTCDLVQLRDGRLGWAGLYPSDAQAQAEHSAAKALPIAAQANPSCGQFGTETPYTAASSSCSGLGRARTPPWTP